MGRGGGMSLETLISRSRKVNLSEHIIFIGKFTSLADKRVNTSGREAVLLSYRNSAI
jgi:hypothetical protein